MAVYSNLALCLHGSCVHNARIFRPPCRHLVSTLWASCIHSVGVVCLFHGQNASSARILHPTKIASPWMHSSCFIYIYFENAMQHFRQPTVYQLILITVTVITRVIICKKFLKKNMHSYNTIIFHESLHGEYSMLF